MTDSHHPRVSVLVSSGNRFEIISILPDLTTLQKLVGGYIELVSDPLGTWNLYCNEEGKIQGLESNLISTLFVDRLLLSDGRGRNRFSSHDVLVGDIVWLGSGDDDVERSLPVDYVKRFTRHALEIRAEADGADQLTIVRDSHAGEVWAFAGPRGFAVPNFVERLVLKARGRTHHGSIQVNVGGRTEDWPQQRAALLDDFPTTQIKEEPA